MAKKSTGKKPTPAPVIGGGQTASTGVAPGYTKYRNPEPDGRLYGGFPFAGMPARGFIQEHRPGGGSEVYFMYNPNEFLYTFSFNAELARPDTIDPVNLLTMSALGGTGVSFTLYFDRHYEVAYGGDQQGVLADVEALKRIVGMKDQTYSYMLMKSLKFTLGSSLVFYGIIQNMSVKLGYFNKNMVPMLAEVGIGAVQVPAELDPMTMYNEMSAITGAEAQSQAATAVATGKPITHPQAAQQVPMRRSGPSIASVW